ncbi:MAG: branched-chain amino acid aminotransferase [Alphaproteobacteria bacterium]
MAAKVYFNGAWHDGNPPIMGALTHGAWLGSVVFDAARRFERRSPDLDLHCRRVVASARAMGLEPMLTGSEIEELARCGINRFSAEAELYIRPMFFAERGLDVPVSESTQFALVVQEMALPPARGFSACLSSFRRPARDMALADSKVPGLYPNVARAIREARGRGVDTAVVLDPAGNVAEFAFTNLFMVREGVVHTPAPNGTFLNGITRQRVIALLREAGTTVVERSILFAEVREADEVFATGNYAKVQPCIRIEDRTLEPGPVYAAARELYWAYTRAGVPS